MPAHILFRVSTSPTVPGSTTAKGSSLTLAEVDGNFKSIVDEINLKANLASPTFTGTPSAPTAVDGTNTTQVATTAFVASAVSTKQATLVSTSNIKSINGVSVIGAGNMVIDPMLYPSAGIPVSSGTAWSTSKASPAGAIVGTSDSQVLTNKSIDLTNNTLTASAAQMFTAVTGKSGTGGNLVFSVSPTFTGTPSGPFSQSAEIDLASAASTDIGGQTSRLLKITGTTGITSFGTNFNGPVYLRFAGVLTLTHNATTLVIPGGANLTTAAGDSCVVVPKTTNSGIFDGWRVDNYVRAATTPGVSGAAITDDTTTNATRYILFDDITTGSATTVGVSSSKLYFNPSTGTLNSTSFNTLSDASMKTNISRIENATSIVENLRGVEFNWADTGKKSAGVIAQELEAVLPHLVDTNLDTGTKSVNYSGIIGYLIESIIELNARILALENK